MPAQARIKAKERAAVEAALQAAFMSGGDADWERLLELTGAASQDDARDGAPCVNLQHADTGGERSESDLPGPAMAASLLPISCEDLRDHRPPDHNWIGSCSVVICGLS